METAPSLGRLLIIAGICLVTGGLFLLYGKDIPVLSKIGKLPGDIRIEREGFKFYFPLTTCLLLNVLLKIILQLFSRFSK
jgi:Protein of unknown function (DUF2905)